MESESLPCTGIIVKNVLFTSTEGKKLQELNTTHLTAIGILE